MNLDDNTCYKLRDKFHFQKGKKKMRVRMSDLKINKNNLQLRHYLAPINIC